MGSRIEEHCLEDALELYALGRLEKSFTAKLEKHLPLCELCRDRLDDTEDFIRAMKGAGARLRSDDHIEPSFVSLLLQTIRREAHHAKCMRSAAKSAVTGQTPVSDSSQRLKPTRDEILRKVF